MREADSKQDSSYLSEAIPRDIGKVSPQSILKRLGDGQHDDADEAKKMKSELQRIQEEKDALRRQRKNICERLSNSGSHQDFPSNTDQLKWIQERVDELAHKNGDLREKNDHLEEKVESLNIVCSLSKSIASEETLHGQFNETVSGCERRIVAIGDSESAESVQ